MRVCPGCFGKFLLRGGTIILRDATGDEVKKPICKKCARTLLQTEKDEESGQA